MRLITLAALIAAAVCVVSARPYSPKDPYYAQRPIAPNNNGGGKIGYVGASQRVYRGPAHLNFCNGSYVMTKTSGHFENPEPFGEGAYDPHQLCVFHFNKAELGVNKLYLRLRLDTEMNYDFVSVYDGDSAKAPRIGHYSGYGVQNLALDLPFTIVFESDGGVQRLGFEIDYDTTANTLGTSSTTSFWSSYQENTGAWGTTNKGWSSSTTASFNGWGTTTGFSYSTSWYGSTTGWTSTSGYGLSDSFHGSTTFQSQHTTYQTSTGQLSPNMIVKKRRSRAIAIGLGVSIPLFVIAFGVIVAYFYYFQNRTPTASYDQIS